jgi:biopolymer transport protein ExbB/TolQ
MKRAQKLIGLSLFLTSFLFILGSGFLPSLVLAQQGQANQGAGVNEGFVPPGETGGVNAEMQEGGGFSLADTPAFIARAFHEGGPVMYLIAIVLAVAIAFIVERYMVLFRQYDTDGNSFMAEIRKYVMEGDIDGAIRVCNGASRSALARVLKAGLSRATRPEDQIQNAVDAASLEIVGKIEKRIGHLAMIANVGVLMGLLGTIFGLIQTFAALGQEGLDPQQKTQMLSAGISEAMNCTAFGLFVAITTMIAHSWLGSKSTKIVNDVDEYSVKLIDLLSASKYRDVPKSPAQG